LNSEALHLRSGQLVAAIGAPRRTHNPGSINLRRDTTHMWMVIESILSHHLDPEDTRCFVAEAPRGSFARHGAS
jgi:hypothetical protein